MPKPPPRWLVRANVAMLAKGLRVGSQHLLTVRGRLTGEPRRTPVSIARVNGERFVVAAFESADWVANVRAAGFGTLTRGADVEVVRLVELPVLERAPVLRAFLEQVPGGRRFFDTPEPDRVIASAERYPVFRVTPPA